MNVYVNSEVRQLEPPASVADLLRELELDPRRLAVEVNLELVPRGRHASHQLRDDDRVEIVTLVGGG